MPSPLGHATDDRDPPIAQIGTCAASRRDRRPALRYWAHR